MKLSRGGKKAQAAAESDAARKTLSDSTSGRSWFASLVLGTFATFLVFVFLGYLQPTMSSSEAITLPDIVQLQTGLGANRKPPPPPKQEAQKKTERKTQKKRVKKSVRKTVVRSKAPRAQQSMRQLNLPAMALDIGIGVGGGGVALPLNLAMDSGDFERELQEVQEYTSTRERVRSESYRARGGGGMRSFGGGVTEPRLIFRPPPTYPRKARQEETEGFVIIKVLISADGSISEFEILGARPEDVFEDAVIDSLPRWRFSPATDSGGRPIEFWKDYKIEFELEE